MLFRLRNLFYSLRYCSFTTVEPPVLHQDDFMRWFDRVPEDKLKEALDFKVLHLDTESHS